MSSCDYWLLAAVCPACQRKDHEHCDPDRCDNPTQLCECREELRLPTPRTANE